jgi:hypothetical protein
MPWDIAKLTPGEWADIQRDVRAKQQAIKKAEDEARRQAAG